MRPSTPLVVGLVVCLLAAGSMIAGVLGVGGGSALGMVGVGIIATSAARRSDG